MKKNILRNSDVSSIYLIYTEGTKKHKISAKIRYLDTKECYLAAELSLTFVKPKKKQPAEIVAYTTDGVYTANVRIMEASLNMNEILYILDLPKVWEYKQLRKSTRKEVKFQFEIKFNDGYTINGETYDISLGGLSYIVNETILEVYKKFPCSVTINIPDNNYINFKAITIKTEAKFLREYYMEYPKDSLCYVFKFTNMSPEDTLALKKYLIYIDF